MVKREKFKNLVRVCSLLMLVSTVIILIGGIFENEMVVLLGFPGFIVTVIILFYGIIKFSPYEHGYDYNLGKLYGAFAYSLKHIDNNDLIDNFRQEIMQDGFKYTGQIENELDATMEVFARGLMWRRDTVLLIQTKQFTLDMLLNHRYLFHKHMADYTGMPNVEWVKRMRTFIATEEMTIPLQVLLCLRDIHGIFANPLVWGGAQIQAAQIFAYIRKGDQLYTKAYRRQSFHDDQALWLRRYFIGSDDVKLEHVWQDLTWKDVEHAFPENQDLIVLVDKALNASENRK